ncbi:hypothetical protein vseg_012685 [Gypsophila vaccaria]
MAKTRHVSKRSIDSYLLKSSNQIITPGDCVLMRPSEPSKPSYVARVEKFSSTSAVRGGRVAAHVRWFYRPEESIGGRRQFHGEKEVFLSDHMDVQSADSIEAKCTVHSFKSYTKLDAIGNDDFFCRFEYNSATGAFTPDRVAVFHPACIEMTAEEAKMVDHFYCHDCSPDDSKKLQPHSHTASRHADAKVDNKRRRG